jgi:hypothetical protein
MKRTVALFVMIAGLAFTARAGLPVQDLSSTSIAVDYSGLWRGEQITKQKVPGHESVHHISVRYAPLPFIVLSAGVGGANFSVDTCQQKQFKGGYNFSPALGVNFYTPFLLKKKLRFTAGVKAHYLYTRNADESFLYSGPFVAPSAGIIVSLGEYVDLEAGARGDIIFGHMQSGSATPQVFSNSEQMRTYVSIMLHTPAEGAYLTVDFDASPKVDMNWSNGPAESSIGISVGFILRQQKDLLLNKSKENADYPGFKEMEKKIEEMEKTMK